ncbi:MAG: hypothetical protein HFI85_02830 [Clostridia bacterium]|jgi:hypothetical protein|nr:hypothetical protein [Clostridia bacterium]
MSEKKDKKKQIDQLADNQFHDDEQILSESEIDNAEDYLFGDRDSAVLRLSHQKNKTDMKEIIPLLKQDLLKYVTYHHKEFVGDIHTNVPVYELMKKFNNETFVSRPWKYEPYMVRQNQIDELQACIKNPVYVKRYQYDRPIYEFQNVISFRDKKARATGEQVKTDIQYYLSKNEDILCAKVVNLKYKPKALKYFGRKRYPSSKIEIEARINDRFLYDRSLSISMYVLLDGDPKKAMPFMRYDNDPHPHTNVWIGQDKRKAVFGEVAQSPHFHFQSEEDAILCLRKFRYTNGKGKYRTGRCNAIDCRHLKNYLMKIDNMGGKLAENELAKNGTYGLPFLKMKINKKALKINVDNLVKDYLDGKSSTEQGYLRYLTKWLDATKDNPDYEMPKNKCFGSLIRALDFIDFMTNNMSTGLYGCDRKMLSEIEVLVANAVVNVINNNQEDYLRKEGKPKYSIECKFDKDLEYEESLEDE